MYHLKSVVQLLVCFCLIKSIHGTLQDEEAEAKEHLTIWNEELEEVHLNFFSSYKAFKERQNMKNRILLSAASSRRDEVQKDIRNKIISRYNFNDFTDKSLKRRLKMMTNLGDKLLPQFKNRKINSIINDMKQNYAEMRIPKYGNSSTEEGDYLSLNPDISKIMEKSRDPEELKYYWLQWYTELGRQNKKKYFNYVELRNEAAKLNNLTSGAEFWLEQYEDESFEEQVKDVLMQIMPLYRQLHGYVRHKLNEKYGDEIVDKKKAIPNHLLGSLFAARMVFINDIIQPYPNRPAFDVSSEMQKQNYTVLKMFQMGDEFFESMNMSKVPSMFWEKTVMEKPSDKPDFICHASAVDSYLENDVSIQMCAQINMNDLITIHHELGHVQYYLQYHEQPVIFKNGANSGFHEAIGDTLSLSVSTPKHLERIGLIENGFKYDDENLINHLMWSALRQIIPLPFAYTLDKFRFGVFRGEIKADEVNTEYWKIRKTFCGIVPPVERTNKDFDAAAMFHVLADSEYFRYFVSYILQFQFYKAACIKANEYEPGNPEKMLSNCDIFGSTDAGNAMKEMLQLGSSKPWPDALEIMTGQRKLDGSAMLEYFKPLEDWLIKENTKMGVTVGWE
ncbi:unnamed protein product [Diamesa hyperborea]